MLLNILQAGDVVLRRPAEPIAIPDIRTCFIQELIDRMKDTMRAAHGVGLAAPQIGEPIQLVVIEDVAEKQRWHWTDVQLMERGREKVDFHVLINPVVTIADNSKEFFFESCLSVNGYCGAVWRASAVRVHALDEKGDPVDYVAEHWKARIVQHEIDHLKGRLYIDRMERWSFMATDEWKRYWKNKPVNMVKTLLQSWDEEAESRSAGVAKLRRALLSAGVDPAVVSHAVTESGME